MLEGNNGNTILPAYVDNAQMQYQADASNQLQLFGNLAAGCNVDPVNYFGNEHIGSMVQPSGQNRDLDDMSKQQRLQISLNYNYCQDEPARSASIPNPNPNPNHVSTGLRLSYDDDERNSSVTSASGSMTGVPPLILSLSGNIRTELNRQKQELDQYVKLQKEQLSKGLREMKQKHTASLLTAIDKGVSKKLREKEAEIENMNRKNQELSEKVKQVATEAEHWQHIAKYNESIVTVLRNNLKQVISMGVDHGKEGFGDSEVDDAVSGTHPSNVVTRRRLEPKDLMFCAGMLVVKHDAGKQQQPSSKENMMCRMCKAKEVSMLLMPCRHLCLCMNCDAFANVCPVCHVMKSASVEVYLS